MAIGLRAIRIPEHCGNASVASMSRPWLLLHWVLNGQLVIFILSFVFSSLSTLAMLNWRVRCA
eukprot:5618434-Lingulodinium_polyedra.AAC.1